MIGDFSPASTIDGDFSLGSAAARPADRTRGSGAMRDFWLAAAALDSVAAALDVHPRTAKTTATPAVRRDLFVIAFPSCSHLEAENAAQNQKNPKAGVEFAHS
jgi:hypothetical protein